MDFFLYLLCCVCFRPWGIHFRPYTIKIAIPNGISCLQLCVQNCSGELAMSFFILARSQISLFPRYLFFRSNSSFPFWSEAKQTPYPPATPIPALFQPTTGGAEEWAEWWRWPWVCCLTSEPVLSRFLHERKKKKKNHSYMSSAQKFKGQCSLWYSFECMTCNSIENPQILQKIEESNKH